jgi:hypothetical protein
MIVELDGFTSETTPEYVVVFEVVTVEVSAELVDTPAIRPRANPKDTVEAILFMFIGVSLVGLDLSLRARVKPHRAD